MKYIFAIAVSGYLLLAGCSSSDDGKGLPVEDPTIPGPVTPGDSGTPSDSVALDNIAQPLLVSLAGYQADQLVFQIDDLAAEISSSVAGVLLDPAEIHTIVQGSSLVTATVRTGFDCDAGGQMIREKSRLRYGAGTLYSYSRDVDTYIFEQCKHSIGGTALPSGDYELTGEVQVDDYGLSGSRVSESGYVSNWTKFSMEGPAGLQYKVAGRIEVVTSSWDPGDLQKREVALEYYQKQQGGQPVELLQNVVFSQNFEGSRGSGTSSFTLNADGLYQGTLTGGKSVNVTTDPVLTRTLAIGNDADQNQPFSGQIQFSSEDNGELLLSANAVGGTGDSESEFFVDSVFLTATGETISNEMIPFVDISVQAPGCSRTHEAENGELGCLPGQQYVIP